MILFSVILLTFLVIVAIMTIAAAGGIFAFLLVFGDVIIGISVLYFILKCLFKNKKKEKKEGS